MSSGPDMEEVVELSLPARPELLSLARLTVAAVASRADFGYEEIEDLRLAIDELCSPLVGPNGKAANLCLRYLWGNGSIEVHCRLEGAGGGSLSAKRDPEARDPEAIAVGTRGPSNLSGMFDDAHAELSDRILDALVDEHGAAADDGTEVWLRKQRRNLAP